MHQTIRRLIIVTFVCSLSSLFSACVQNAGDNSNVAVLYRETPTPAPVAEATPEASSSVNALLSAVPSPALSPSLSAVPSPAESAISPPADASTPNNEKDVFVADNNKDVVMADSEALTIPVVGVRRTDLRDTFNDARSDNRVHDAIDIMAAGGTPVVAATNGKIIKFFDSERGGITIYQLGTDEQTVYYYAHLQKRADNLREGDVVRQGTLLGYVGDTGNSGAGNFHLHFAIWTISDPKRFFDGANINPYPLLKQGKEQTTVDGQQ